MGKSKHYQSTSFHDAYGHPIPWVHKVSNSVISDRLQRKGDSFRGDLPYYLESGSQTTLHTSEERQRDGLAFITAEKACGQIISQYLLDEHIEADPAIPVPIIYPPDSGMPFAQGIKQEFTNRGFAGVVYKASKANTPGRHFNSAEAMEAARKANCMILCDGVTFGGESLLSLLNAVPTDFTGKVIVAVNIELSSPAYNLKASQGEYCSNNRLIKRIKEINEGLSNEHFQVVYCFAHKGDIEIEKADMATSVKIIQETKKAGKSWLGQELVKTQFPPEICPPRTI